MPDKHPHNSIARHLLTLGGIAMVMSPLAVLHPWIAGCGSFLVMTIVVGIVALQGDRRETALIVGIATLLSSGVCWYAGGDLNLLLALLVSLIGTVTLGVLSVIVCKTSHIRLQKINDLETQQFELVRKVYDYDRGTCLSGEIPVFGMNSVSDAPRNSSEKPPRGIRSHPPLLHARHAKRHARHRR